MRRGEMMSRRTIRGTRGMDKGGRSEREMWGCWMVPDEG